MTITEALAMNGSNRAHETRLDRLIVEAERSRAEAQLAIAVAALRRLSMGEHALPMRRTAQAALAKIAEVSREQ